MFSTLFNTSLSDTFLAIRDNDLNSMLSCLEEYCEEVAEIPIDSIDYNDIYLEDGNLMECAILHRASDIIEFFKSKNCVYSLDLFKQLRREGREEEMAEYFPVSGECSICGMDAEFEYLHDCCHAFCADCLDGWFQAHIDSFKFNIICPQKDCHHEVNGTDIMKHLSCERLVRLFEEKSFEMAIQRMEGFIWCPECEAPGFHLGSENCAECSHCDHRFCPRCRELEHPGWSCDDYAAMKGMDENEIATFWISKRAKVCPSCKVPIEKNGGCSHMSCQSCSYQFCWICGRKYNGSYVFDSSCKCASNPHPEDKFFEEIPVIWAGRLALV